MRCRELLKLFFLLLLIGYVVAQTSTSDTTSGTGTGTDSGTRTGSRTTTTATSTTSTRRGPTIITTACCAPSRNQTLSQTRTGTRSIPGRPHTPGFDRPPPPFPTAPPPEPPASSSNRGGQSPVEILFEVIGGIVGILIIFSLGRCIYKYKRTPRQDRVAALVDRHMLERELAEMEEAQAPRALVRGRRASLVRPPPPYQRAPDYDEVVVAQRTP